MPTGSRYTVSKMFRLNCYPPILGTPGEDAVSLDTKTDAGNAYQRLITQVSWLWSISREGALFDLIGRRQ